MSDDIPEPGEYLPDPPEVHVYEVAVTPDHLNQLRETGELEIEWEPHEPDPEPDRIVVILHAEGEDDGPDSYRITGSLE